MKITKPLFLASFFLIVFTAASVAEGQKKPVYDEYRGVKIGMPVAEARKALGRAKEQADTEDFYEFDDGESARVLYDPDKTVRIISATYTEKLDSAPKAINVVGEDLQPGEGGSMFKMVQYPEHGFWVSYFRTAGDEAMIIITMQKMLLSD